MNEAVRDAGSMDWRFLPELPASGQALLLGAADEGLAASFTVTTMPQAPRRLPAESVRFDLIALPDGLSAAARLPELAQRLKPDGVLYLSFASPWKRFWRPDYGRGGTRERMLYAPTLRGVRQQLVQAGLQPVAIYGALPDHLHPAYLFPLTPAAVQHVFRQTVSPKFARWPALVKSERIERLLTHRIFTRTLAHFLPTYAVIGKMGVSTPAADAPMADCLSALAQQHWSDSAGRASPPAAWHWVLQTNGAYAAHNNLLLFGFPAAQSQPALVAKICRTPRHSHTLQTEYIRLGQLWRALGERAAGRAPQPLALAQHGADRVLLMSYCRGDPLLTAPAHFWQDRQQVEKLLHQAAAWLRHLHQGAARLDEALDDASATEADFKRKAVTFAGIFPLSPAAQDEVDHLVRQITQAQASAAGYTLLQGDFWPGNVLLPAAAPAGGLHPDGAHSPPPMTLVDWQFSRWDNHTTLDVYLFVIVCAVKSAVYTPSYAARARQAAQRLLAWRADLLPAYLAAYGQPAPYRLLPPRPGLLASCVELAVRPYLAFGLMQPDAEQWYTLFTEISRLWPPES